jgi:hypothetical protein
VSCRTEDILLTVDHLAKMIDSAMTQDCPRIIGRLEELKVKASLRLTASQSIAIPSLPDKERYLGVEEVTARFHVSQVAVSPQTAPPPQSAHEKDAALSGTGDHQVVCITEAS